MVRKLVKNGFVLLNSLLVFFTFLAYLSRFVSPDTYWFVSVIGLGFPWLVLMNIGFIIFWIWNKKKYLLVSLITLILGFNHVESFFNISIPEKAEANDFHLISYNIANLGPFKKLGADEPFDVALRGALSENASPDIICLQETSYRLVDGLKKQLKFKYSYAGDKRGTVILSKFPIVESGIVDIQTTGNGAIWALLKTPQGLLKVYNVHLQSNKITREADNLAKNLDLEDRKTYSTMKGMIGSYKRAAIMREKQAKILLASIQKDDMPVVVCGDFNETPQSLVYAYFGELLQDGFVEKGKGLATTFNGSIPLLRIDHVFASSALCFKNYKTLSWSFSDHFPVMASFQFKEP